MKENKGRGLWLGWITGGGTYKEGKFEDDADKVHGRTTASAATSRRRSASRELKILEDSKDGKTRWVQLQIPVTEGPRYKVGEVDFSGNTVVKTEGLRPLFKVEKGDWLQREDDPEGLREGAARSTAARGYFEFTGVPEYAFPNDPKAPGATTAAAADSRRVRRLRRRPGTRRSRRAPSRW